MKESQAQAIRRLLTGTREEITKGVELLYREERPKIFRKLAYYCSPTELEELFDDALMVLLKKVAFINKNPIVYFWQICRNKASDIYRTSKGKELILTEEDQLVLLQDQSINLEAPLAEIDGEQVFLYAIQSLMNKLGEADREILIRRYFQDWSNQDLAEEEGITKQSAATKVYRILEKLRKILANEPWLKETLEAYLYEAFQSN